MLEWRRRLAHRLSDVLPPKLAARLAAGHYRRLFATLGPEAEPDLQVCLTLLQSGAGFVDLGANVGLYTLACARRVGAHGWVLAMEPMPWAYAVLERLAAASGCNNIRLVQAAAGEVDGRLWMSVPRDRQGLCNHYLARVTERPDRRSLRVSARTLDGLLGSRAVDLVKIDVEGHELACLRGAVQSIRRSRPALLVEIGGPAGAPSAAERAAVFALLDGLGYRIFMLEDGQLRPYSDAQAGVNHWFLQPGHVDQLGRRAPELFASASDAVG